jgi:hypothetical protein
MTEVRRARRKSASRPPVAGRDLRPTGQMTEAKAEAVEVLQIDPVCTIDGAARLFLPRDQGTSLQKAGLPEK